MAGYAPLKITGMTTGLVQEREEFLLPDDAYPTLQNAYVWRERIKRKQGCQLLGRLQRNFVASSLGVSPAALTWSFNFYTTVIPNITETNKELIPGTVIITDGTDTFTDQGNGTLKRQDNNVTSTINYITGAIILNRTVALANAFTVNFSYAPGLPVMGIRIREQQNSANDQTVFFDEVYAYKFDGVTQAFTEFLPGTTWTGGNSDFFWTTNYWIGNGNLKIFWATNNVDPIRFTNGAAGTNWVDFTPIINAMGEMLLNALILLPFRGRLVAFNTTEVNPGQVYTNRIRWAAIGNPFTVPDPQIMPVVTVVNPNAWLDDKRGQGGFLDIPTSEDIISVGFVRDNLVIYCENSTWQLRYTGRTIAPFQIEKVNSELGALGTFSAIQFDTSLVGFGDKGIVECDSYKSNLIDIKIPDLVFDYQHQNAGPTRVHGIRDFENRLAYWVFPSAPANGTFPDQRLVYNYENDSWALFNDSYTTLGTFQEPSSRNWVNTHLPWIRCNFPWISQPALIPTIVAGNQQGFVERIAIVGDVNTNDISLSITNITGATTTPTVVTSPNHNLQSGAVIEIYDIPIGTPFDNLNFAFTFPYNNVFSVVVLTANTFSLNIYDPTTQEFSKAQVDPVQTYIGGGKIAIRDNFSIQSKKFNFIDEGESIQLGYLDLLMEATGSSNESTDGAISLNVYLDYNITQASNTLPMNNIDNAISVDVPDTFFNATIPTTQSPLNNKGGTKFWQRVFCSTRANFLTLEYTFSNAQMASSQQTTSVQIDAQVLWIRKAGRLTQI